MYSPAKTNRRIISRFNPKPNINSTFVHNPHIGFERANEATTWRKWLLFEEQTATQLNYERNNRKKYKQCLECQSGKSGPGNMWTVPHLTQKLNECIEIAFSFNFFETFQRHRVAEREFHHSIFDCCLLLLSLFTGWIVYIFVEFLPFPISFHSKTQFSTFTNR